MNNKNLQFLEKQITRKVGKAIEDYNLIEDGDRIMLAHSGGKDSWTLLHILKKLQKKAPVKFDIFVATVDLGFPGFQTKLISNYLKENMNGQPYLINNSSIYQIILNHKTPKKSICSFCSRLRRGILYRLAREHRLNKIALAHHSCCITNIINSKLIMERLNTETNYLFNKIGTVDSLIIYAVVPPKMRSWIRL
jgi:tRNA 2-thiocytidine biosynthesis protein TtcA